jgi:hypothetical protein
MATVESPDFPSLYRHSTRPAWGVGILSGEHDGKRSYLFEDGEERTLGAAGIELMRVVDHPDRDQQETCSHLLSLLAKRAGRRDTQAPLKSAVEKQLARFHKKYHGGFFSGEWRNDTNNAFARRVRGSIAQNVQERLSAQRMSELLEREDFAAVWNEAVALVNASGLAAGDLQSTTAQAEQRLLAEAVYSLLHGQESYEHRFDRWIAALASVFRDGASWQTATALAAMMTPVDHVYVEPTSFRKQLKLMARPSAFGARPTGAAYVRCLAAAQALANMLATQGEVPRDLLDVHDFIRTTS